MKRTIYRLIEEVLNRIGLYSEDAVRLVYETGLAESRYRHLEQINGPALGFFQIEPATVRDIWENYALHHPKIRDSLFALGFDESELEFRIISNIALQIALCRLTYRRDPDEIPNNMIDRAAYWKKVYNTRLGKGTLEHYLKACQDA